MRNLFSAFIVSVISCLALNAGASAGIKKSVLIAGVVDTHGEITVYLNTREEWRANHRLTDSYSDAEQILVDEVTDQLNLCNEMESTYVPCTEGRTAAQIRKELITAGVEVHRGFEKWITNEVQ